MKKKEELNQENVESVARRVFTITMDARPERQGILLEIVDLDKENSSISEQTQFFDGKVIPFNVGVDLISQIISGRLYHQTEQR